MVLDLNSQNKSLMIECEPDQPSTFECMIVLDAVAGGMHCDITFFPYFFILVSKSLIKHDCPKPLYI